MSPALIAYRLLTRLIEPLVPRLLDARVKQGKEDAARVDERLGIAGVARPAGDLVWLHGVSVGETLSMLPLVERIRKGRPDLTILVTSGTVTSATLLAQRLPPGVIHQFAPVDGPGAVAQFLDHWKPALGILVESELWPNLITMAADRGVKLALVSARITRKTAEGWARFPGAARRVLTRFDLIMPQDASTSDHIETLGGRTDVVVNLKLSGGPLPHDPGAFSALSAAIGDRSVVVAASTHPGEEIAIVRTLDGMTQPHAQSLCLILVPRHPERGPEIATALTRDGYGFAMRSRGSPLTPETDIYVADTLGELGLFLRLADVVIMGGSFAHALGRPTVGGHNPLEPARLGKPVVSGDDAQNWSVVTSEMREAGGLIIVSSPDSLPGVIAPLLADPDAARAMGERARRAAADAGSGLELLWQSLQPLLPPVRRVRN